MVEIFGEFDEDLPPGEEYLRIQFSPSSTPLKQRWRNNGLSADFMADYLITFFPKSADDEATQHHQKEIKSSISYIANELLENAMKFSESGAHQPISITLHLLSDRLIFLAANGVSKQAKERLQTFIQRLSQANLEDLYTEQLEKTALDDAAASSGLGILTMMNDYLAKIGWKFESVSNHPESFIVTTMVQLVV